MNDEIKIIKTNTNWDDDKCDPVSDILRAKDTIEKEIFSYRKCDHPYTVNIHGIGKVCAICCSKI